MLPISGIPVALAIDGLSLRPASASAQLHHATELARVARCTALQLDGKMPGLRARELDRSARREVASVLRREGLGLAGIDLWIPPAHFAQNDRVDRATEAVCEACELAADVARLVGSSAPVVCIEWPADVRDGVTDTIAAAAARTGVHIADFGPRSRQSAVSDPLDGPLGIGIDPAGEVLAGGDPVIKAGSLGQRLVAARLTDAQHFGRCLFGAGRLDTRAFKATLSVATRATQVVLDVRGVAGGSDGLSAAVDAWNVA